MIIKAAIDKPFEVFMATMFANEFGVDNINNAFIPNPLDKTGFPIDNFVGSADEILTAKVLKNFTGL